MPSTLDGFLLLSHPSSMSGQPIKRARLNPGSRRDVLPLPDDNDKQPIQSIEAKLTRVGGSTVRVRQTPIVRTPLEAQSSVWANLQQWAPVDNSTYALDPENGEWYDEALSEEVMDAHRPSVSVEKKKYKRSKVSVGAIRFVSHVYKVNLFISLRNDPM